MDMTIRPAYPGAVKYDANSGRGTKAPSGSAQLSMIARQTEALLPSDLTPAGPGTDGQEVAASGQEQARLADDIRQMAEKANTFLRKADTFLEFTVSEETGRIVINVIDSQTKEVIRAIPPEAMERFSSRMTQMRGLLFDVQG